MRWAAGSKQPILTRLSLPLWQLAGPARIHRGGDKGARYLALTWENAQTRYVLRLAEADDEVSDSPEDVEEGPVHRPLIRATLPRPEGPPSRVVVGDGWAVMTRPARLRRPGR